MLPTTDYARFYARLIGIALEGRGEEGRREKRREGRALLLLRGQGTGREGLTWRRGYRRGGEGNASGGKGREGEVKGRGGDIVSVDHIHSLLVLTSD